MPWCPNCRAEYRPGFTHCAKCQTPLVEAEPGQPPRVAGWLVEEKTAASLQKLLPFRQQFIDGLQVARRALSLTLNARKLLLVVLLLATLSFLGSTVQTQIMSARLPQAERIFQDIPQEKPSLGEQWRNQFHSRSVLSYLLQNVDDPLAKSTGAASPWLMTVLYSSHLLDFPSWDNPAGTDFWLFLLISFWSGGIFVAISALVLVGLLGWLQALANSSHPESWKAYLRAHFWPIFLFSLIYAMSVSLIFLPGQLLAFFHGPEKLLSAAQGSSYFVSGWLLPPIRLFLMLAPFAMVSLNLGAWGGVKAGMRMLWQKKWVLLAVLIVYRIAFEILLITRLAVPFPRGPEYGFGQRLLLGIGPWLVTLALAFLGLWLAMAFTLLVQPKSEPETAAALDGPPN